MIGLTVMTGRHDRDPFPPRKPDTTPHPSMPAVIMDIVKQSLGITTEMTMQSSLGLIYGTGMSHKTGSSRRYLAALQNFTAYADDDFFQR